MKKSLISSFILIFALQSISAQYNSTPIFSMGEKILMDKAPDGKFYYHHKIKKGQTLYALSKTFGHSLEKLKSLNNKPTTEVNLGEKIKVEIPQNYLFKGMQPNKIENTVYVPVIYTAKPKDNLYRISKVYFNQPIEMIQKRNNMITTNISVGKEIILGWYPLSIGNSTSKWTPQQKAKRSQLRDRISAMKAKATKVNNSSNSEVTLISNESFSGIEAGSDSTEDFNDPLLGQTLLTENMTLVTEKDVANWDKNISDNGEIYVLHNKAKVDTYIELKNEIVGRTINAKVIGRIPFGAYTSDVKLIISPAAAKALGALDERLRVSLTYYK